MSLPRENNNFNPLPPHGGRRTTSHGRHFVPNFNPLPPHGGRRMYEAEKKQEVDISIHSLRMEGDKDLEVSELRPSYFNPLPPHGGRPFFFYIPVYGHFISIHSLRMEGDYPVAFFVYVVILFQSTPSAWRETVIFHTFFHCFTYFNPLPPHGGRLLPDLHILPINHFNPLPPHGGRRQYQ